MAYPEFNPGVRARFTGKFLKNTGQQVGPEGRKVFTVQECACGLCNSGCVAVDEPHEAQTDPRGYEDIPPKQRPKWRHINKANLMIVGAHLRANDFP